MKTGSSQYLSYFSLFNNLGGITGNMTAYFVAKYNPKLVINLSRVGLAISFLCLTVQNAMVLLLGRYLNGVFTMVLMNTSVWVAYEIFLESHQPKVMIAYHLSISAHLIITTFTSNFDPRDAFYWRVVVWAIASSQFLLIFLEMIFVKNINLITYLLQKLGYDGALEVARTVYSEELAVDKVHRISECLKYEEEKKEQQRRLGQSTFEVWLQDLFLYKKSVLNLILVSLCALSSLQLQYVSFGLLIGSKNLDNVSATSKTKFMMTVVEVLEFTGYIVMLNFKFAESRKRSLMTAQFLGTLSVTVIAFGYLFKDLKIVRAGMLFIGLSFPLYFPSLHLYTNDLVPPNLVPFHFVTISFWSITVDFFFPKIFEFEESSFESIGFKFACCALVGYACTTLLGCFMLETRGMNRLETKKLIDGKDAGAFKELGLGPEPDIDGVGGKNREISMKSSDSFNLTIE